MKKYKEIVTPNFHKIHEKLIVLKFDNQKDMCRACVRIEESYENPSFNNRAFTLGQIRQHYIKETGGFDYFEAVQGFNIPCKTLLPFFTGMFDPLSPEESNLIELLRGVPDDYYIIGVYEDEDEGVATFNHEIAHGMFSVIPSYRESIISLIDTIQIELKPLIEFLIKNQYSPEVFVDECNSYMSCDQEYLKEKGISFPIDLATTLKTLFEEYKEDHINDKGVLCVNLK